MYLQKFLPQEELAHLAVQVNSYKEEFLKTNNIKTQQDLNKYIKKMKPVNLGIFISSIKRERL